MFEFIYSSYHGSTIYVYNKSSDCFEYPKNPSSNKANPKILAKFSYPKNPGIENFKPKKLS